MKKPALSFSAVTRSLLAGACVLSCVAAQAATIHITSRDAAGVGFNDTTPVAPVGGNNGTTLGEQRLNVYKYVAHVWEQALSSPVTIEVSAGWEALTCTSTTAVLGSAAAWNIWHDFPGGKPGTWYPQALANKLAQTNLSAGQPDDGSGYGNVDIKTQFNINLGNPGCLDGSRFYLGLDGKAGGNINFVETLLHELGHGLGFSVLTVQTSTGYRVLPDGSDYSATDGLPSVWEGFMYDNTAAKTWLNMTNAERKASAVNPLKLAWNGPKTVSGATFLSKVPVLKIATSVPGAAGLYDYSTATFGPLPTQPGPYGYMASIATQAGEAGPGCSPFDAGNTMAVKGKVALISRGSCPFVQKVKNAQNAGAIAVVLADNVTAATPIAAGGSDATITIPAIGVTLATGNTLRSAIAAAPMYGSRSRPGTVTATLDADPARTAGADSAGRPLLYTPATLVPGSSVSHWDVSASPNLLMEPNINPDLGTSVVPPYDLTLPLLQDIGW